MDPRLLGITLLIRSFTNLKEMISKTLEVMTPSEWKGRAEAIKAGADALQQSAISTNAYWHELYQAKSASEQLAAATEANIAALRAEEAAQLAVLDAKEKAGMIGAEQAKQERARTKEKADRDELNKLMLEQASLAIQIGNLTKDLPGIQSAAGQATASNATITKEQEIYAGNVASSNAKIAEYEAEFEARKNGKGRSGLWDSYTDADLKSAYASEVSARDSAQGILNNFNTKAVGVYSRNNATISDASAAEGELTASRNRYGTLSGQIAAKNKQMQLDRDTNMSVAGIEAGDPLGGNIISKAAAGADSILGGGRADAGQSAAINYLTKQLGLQGLSNKAVLQIMSRMNDTQENFIKSLQQLEKKVNANNQR